MFDAGLMRGEDQSSLASNLFRLVELHKRARDFSGADASQRKLLAFYERLATQSPADPTYRASLAGQCFNLAELLTHFAQSACSTTAQRATHWQEARAVYERAARELRKAAELGLKPEQHPFTAEQIAQTIARCEVGR
jgi:hypothetical protein